MNRFHEFINSLIILDSYIEEADTFSITIRHRYRCFTALFAELCFDFFDFDQLQGLCRTDIDADRLFHVKASITLDGDLPLRGGGDYSIGTEGRTGRLQAVAAL
jgi:hypothetical protein